MAIGDTITTIETDVEGFLGKNTWAKVLAIGVVGAVVAISTYFLGANSPVTVAINKVGYELVSSTTSDTTVTSSVSGTTIVTKPGASVSLTTPTPTIVQ